MQFTHTSLQALKAKTKRYELVEDSGLGIRVSTTGAKSFIYRYTYLGRPRCMTLGPFPAMGLSAARDAHFNATKQLLAGEDPGRRAIEARRQARQADTVAELVVMYLKHWSKPNKRSWRKDHRILFKELVPDYGQRKVHEIKRADIIRVIDRVVDRGAPIAANRTLEVIRHLFWFAIERGLIEHSPCQYIRKPQKARTRDRVLNEEEIPIFWDKVDQIEASAPIKFALKFQLVTGQRRGEIVKARWEDIDLTSRWWGIPNAHAKNAKAHRVPLSSLAIELLETLKPLTGSTGFLLPAPNKQEPMTDHALTRAITRNWERFGLHHFTSHDLRRTAASQLAQVGVQRLILKKLLNHVDHDVTGIYDRYSYDKEKMEAMTTWRNRLRRLVADPGLHLISSR